jgi:hypothetical protein
LQIIIETDQPLVEGGVVEAVEGDAVADVEAFCLVAAPWEDVGGDEEFADRKAGEGTAVS